MKRSAWVRSLPIIFVLLIMAQVCLAQFGVSIRVGFAPPELPVYEQPLCPGEGYIWTPGYWAWDADGDDYYWVPGTWVLAPEIGYFWTPPYWGWADGAYVFYPGYWGPHVGFYGGIAYGFGYFGHGYDGGRWENGHFFYNRYVSNVNVTVIHNVYETRVEERNINVARVSYNGGNGGVNARPTAEEESFNRERHIAATPVQSQHMQEAMRNTQFRASVNRGRPPVAATSRPGEFSGSNVVAARSGGNYAPPANRGNAGGGAARNDRPPSAAIHPKDLPSMERGAAPNTGNAKLDQKYQQQQAKLYEKQNQERQKLQQKQDQEHQKFEQQQAQQMKQQQQEAQRQQQQQQKQQQQQEMEQRHQQQTQEMYQRHAQQQQQMQQRQAPPPHEGGQPHH